MADATTATTTATPEVGTRSDPLQAATGASDTWAERADADIGSPKIARCRFTVGTAPHPRQGSR